LPFNRQPWPPNLLLYDGVNNASRKQEHIVTPFYTLRFPAALALAYGLSGCVGGSDTYEAALTSATATSGTAAVAAKAAVKSAKYDVEGFDSLAGEATKNNRYFYMWKPA
jgi:hypothetical protein